MTLIADFKVHGLPIMVGDILLTAEKTTRSGVSVRLPLVGDINELYATQALPLEASVTQKINILHDRLIVAWAGPLKAADKVLRALDQTCQKKNFSAKDMANAINAIKPSKISGLALVGFVLEDRDKGYEALHFQLGAKAQTINPFGQVFFAGSGQRLFLECLGRVGQQTDRWGHIPRTTLPRAMSAALTTQLTGHEISDGSNLLDRWGGGFEAAYWAGGKFVKLGNRLHTFWTARQSGADWHLTMKPWFYKVDYWEKYLVVRSLSAEPVDGRHIVRSDELHIVSPTLLRNKKIDLAKMPKPIFEHEILSCHVKLLEGDDFSLAHANSEQLIYLEEAGDFLHLRISDRLIRMLVERMQHRPGA